MPVASNSAVWWARNLCVSIEAARHQQASQNRTGAAPEARRCEGRASVSGIPGLRRTPGLVQSPEAVPAEPDAHDQDDFRASAVALVGLHQNGNQLPQPALPATDQGLAARKTAQPLMKTRAIQEDPGYSNMQPKAWARLAVNRKLQVRGWMPRSYSTSSRQALTNGAPMSWRASIDGASPPQGGHTSGNTSQLRAISSAVRIARLHRARHVGVRSTARHARQIERPRRVEGGPSLPCARPRIRVNSSAAPARPAPPLSGPW